MMTPGGMSVATTVPDVVVVEGLAEAIANADELLVINLGLAMYVGTDILADGSFDAELGGTPADLFRLIAVDTPSGRFESVVVTDDGTLEGLRVVDPDELGCLRVEPVFLDLGVGPPGEPLYGQFSVQNHCELPASFLSVSSDSLRFTPVSLLLEDELAAGGQSIVSVTYLSPGGQDETLVTVEPVVPAPEQAPLIVFFRARSTP